MKRHLAKAWDAGEPVRQWLPLLILTWRLHLPETGGPVLEQGYARRKEK